MGYATGDDHLYLVYVYIPNGSLSDHLHDPLMKGIQIHYACTSVRNDPINWSIYKNNSSHINYERHLRLCNVTFEATLSVSKLQSRTEMLTS